jgi:hypothetical protein
MYFGERGEGKWNRIYLANIWATNYLTGGIVISVKILGVKFLRYIAKIKSMDNKKGRAITDPARLKSLLLFRCS